ncbi:hypothetical protein DMC25_22770 [Caulobacter sp. D4A]|uniref:hypothetical protein n=1 Tax=unclassified Caulobacter TaxID=2648921 RepID=UPI000D737AF0|nr:MULTISPECIES: hypothetical protein [unclassified Caulobacter]PXA78113.1 hypothetical protein DMC25_22770 [Caulobacter sp. D4A]PXA92723.1 hypothetical protein DMC18_10275 [Caulobacter sp. D5]
MDVDEHIERVARARPGKVWRDVVLAVLAVTGFAVPALLAVLRMRSAGTPLTSVEWISLGVMLLAPAAVFLAAYGLWRRGRRQRPVASKPPVVLD